VDAEGEAISSGGNLIDDLVESVGARAAAALMIGGYRSRAAPGIEMDGVLGSAAVAPMAIVAAALMPIAHSMTVNLPSSEASRPSIEANLFS